MSSQYYDKDQVDQKLSQNLDRVEEVGKEVKLDVTKDVKAEVETFTASTTTKVNTLEGKVNQLDSKTTELNSNVAVYNQKVDNLNSAVSSETSTISIKPTDTATYLATLPNAVYRAASAGTYQFTTLPDFDVVVNKIVPEGYSVKFLKDASGWNVAVVERLPDTKILTYKDGVPHVGPTQVYRYGSIWELPEGEVSNGTETQSPANDTRWIKKVYSYYNSNLDNSFTPYVVVDGIVVDNSNKSNYTEILDKSIKKLSLIVSKLDTYRYVWLKTFNVKKLSETQLQCTIRIALTNVLEDSITSNDISTIADTIYTINSDGDTVVYGSSDYGNFELVLDSRLFDLNKQYNYSTVKTEGLIQAGVINYIYPKYFRDNIKDQYTQYKGNAFAFYRGVRDVTFRGHISNKELRLIRLEKTSSQVIIDFRIVNLIDNTRVTARKTYTHAEFVGTLQATLVAISGTNFNNADYGVAITIDADYMNRHYGSQTYKIEPINADTPIYGTTPISETQLCDNYSFDEAGYSDYRGMWYDNGSYRRMSIGKFIPKGATKIKATGGFDKNANILFGDENGQLIGYAWTNEDGTKYSGNEVRTSIEADIPSNARYFHASTLNANLSTASVRVLGDFNFDTKKDVTSIQEAILDNHKSNEVFSAGKFIFIKQGTNVNNIDILSADNLALADDYSASELIQGQSKGQLVYYKDDKFYYYNGSTREIYYELNGIKTTITSPILHPTAWVNSIAQGQERTVIEVLADNSILFSMKEQLSNGNIIYSCWKVAEGSEPVKKFIYSNNFFTKEDNTVQSANGCPVGEWSFEIVKDLIFATEYGQGTSEWWYNQALSGGNGKGVSSRVWVSNDNGDTWYNCLNLSELKDISQPISDSNWKYFSDTQAKNQCHIHFIKYDNYGDRIYISNGDGENYLWSISYKEIKNFLTSANPINPDVILSYTRDSGLTWNAIKLCNYGNHPNINYHNMKFQMTAMYPTEAGLLLGHDAPREFMYFAHRKGVLNQSTFKLEPTYNFEFRSDFNTDSEFKSSKDKTDGFVMSMTRFTKSEPILIFHSASGKYCRIWATYNGINHKIVFESENKEITFANRVFFDNKGNIILTTGATEATNNSGYYLLSN